MKRPLTSFAVAYFAVRKIAIIARYDSGMIALIFDLGIRLATFAVLAAAFFRTPGAGLRARNRAWGSVVAIPCSLPAGPRGREMSFPAGRTRDLAQVIDYARDYRQNRADFGAETKILPDLREARAPPGSDRAEPGDAKDGVEGRPSSPPRGRRQWDSVAVVGSIMRQTSVILFAGKPLRRACS